MGWAFVWLMFSTSPAGQYRMVAFTTAAACADQRAIEQRGHSGWEVNCLRVHVTDKADPDYGVEGHND